MKQIFVLGALAFALSGCASVSDLPPGYAPRAQDADGLAVVSLTLSGKDLNRVSSFEYRVREAAGASVEEVERSSYFHSALQHARWLQDHDAQGPVAKRVKLVVKGPALAEPLDVVESGMRSPAEPSAEWRRCGCRRGITNSTIRRWSCPTSPVETSSVPSAPWRIASGSRLGASLTWATWICA